MNRSLLGILLLMMVAIHQSAAQISLTISLQRAAIDIAANALTAAVKGRAADVNATFKSMINGAIYTQDWTKYWMGYVLADPVTGPIAKNVTKQLTASGQDLLNSIAPVQANITASFQAVGNALSASLNSNVTAAMDAAAAASANITAQFSSTTSSKQLTCWFKYVGSPAAIVTAASTAFQAVVSAETAALSRTLTALSDYANLAGNNFRSMGTTADYCNGIGLSRPDLKRRTVVCLQSLLDYAIPQLNANLQYQQDIVTQLAATEAGNSVNRLVSGIMSVTEQATTAARLLPDDVANCFKTGV